jgi:hypothetical protein
MQVSRDSMLIKNALSGCGESGRFYSPSQPFKALMFYNLLRLSPLNNAKILNYYNSSQSVFGFNIL